MVNDSAAADRNGVSLHCTALCITNMLGPVNSVEAWVWQVWHTGQCKCVHTLRGHKQPVQRIAICGGRLYSTAGRNIRVWDVATFECLQVIKTQQDCGALLAMTAAPDGTVYVGGQVSLHQHSALHHCMHPALHHCLQTVIA